MSASLNWIAWNCAIGWSKALRFWAYSAAHSREAAAMPSAWQAGGRLGRQGGG
jgi:hypothetical protein